MSNLVYSIFTIPRNLSISKSEELCLIARAFNPNHTFPKHVDLVIKKALTEGKTRLTQTKQNYYTHCEICTSLKQ